MLAKALRSSVQRPNLLSARYLMKEGAPGTDTTFNRGLLSAGKIEDAGDYFKYKYMFDDMPETVARFNRMGHNAYGERTLYEWDNWQFE